jgi:hypothetical protein
MNTDGTGVRQLVQTLGTFPNDAEYALAVLNAQISQDGNQVLYLSPTDDQGNSALSLVNWNGGGTRTVIVNPSLDQVQGPLSPNASEIAYGDPTGHSIDIIGTDGALHRTISCGGGGTCHPVAWVNVPRSLAGAWAK